MDCPLFAHESTPLLPCCIELTALREEIARLKEDNDDLRASARLWSQLYEAALARENTCNPRIAAAQGP